jgi:hypothetical protein
MGQQGQETYSTDSESGKRLLLNWLDQQHIDWAGKSADQLGELLQKASGELHLLVPNNTQDTISLFRQLMQYKPGQASDILGRVELYHDDENCADGQNNPATERQQAKNDVLPSMVPKQEPIDLNDVPSDALPPVAPAQNPIGLNDESSPGGDQASASSNDDSNGPPDQTNDGRGDDKGEVATNAQIRQALTENEIQYGQTEMAINQYTSFIDRYLGALATPPLPPELPRTINNRVSANLQCSLAFTAVERLENYSDPDIRKNLDAGQYSRVLADTRGKVDSALEAERHCADRDYHKVGDLLSRKAEIQDLSGDAKGAQETRQKEREIEALAKLQDSLKEALPDKEAIQANLKELAATKLDSFEARKLLILVDELDKASAPPESLAHKYTEIAERLFGKESKVYADRLGQEATALYEADLNGGPQLDQAIRIYRDNGLSVSDNTPVWSATNAGLTYGASYIPDADGKVSFVATDEASARFKQVKEMRVVSTELEAALATSETTPLNFISYLGLVSLAEKYDGLGAHEAAQQAALILEDMLPVLQRQDPDEDYAKLEERLAKLRKGRSDE